MEIITESKNEKFVVKHSELGYLANSNQWTAFEKKFSKNIEDAKLYDTPKKCIQIMLLITTNGYDLRKDAVAERSKMSPKPVNIIMKEV